MSPALAKHAAPISMLSWVFLALGLGVFALAGIGWSSHVRHDGDQVAAKVVYAGVPVEGLTPEAVEDVVAERAQQVLSQDVTIEVGDQALSVPLNRLGFSYDIATNTRDILETRHQGTVWSQFSSWAVGGFATAKVDEVWSFDRQAASTALEHHPGLTPTVVREPEIVSEDGHLIAVHGQAGTEADVDGIVDALSKIDLLNPPRTIEAVVDTRPPEVTDLQVDQLAEHLNDLTSEGVDVAVEGRQVVLPESTLNRYLSATVENGQLVPHVDGPGLQQTLESTFVGPVGDFTHPTFNVVDDQIQVVSVGETPPVCCKAGIGEWLGTRLIEGAAGPFSLPSRPSTDPELTALADGSYIVDKVSEFTTPHHCCETRVKNIDRIADIVRGYYLIPGETLSLNAFVGPRTKENGFFSAGAIRQGHLISEVGGGVSQFATTIFNAAFFAGLDFVEYQSHSIYFSRYPYGREATISNPRPDLSFTNTTPYPILIWTSYTDTSITVSMYSTNYVDVVDLGQTSSRRGQCTHVDTKRQRTYQDGTVVVDGFVADYRPAEGLDCNGKEIPEPDF
jgi:VanW like protein